MVSEKCNYALLEGRSAAKIFYDDFFFVLLNLFLEFL